MLSPMQRLILTALLTVTPGLAYAAGPTIPAQLQEALKLTCNPAPEQAWARLQRLQAVSPGLPARTIVTLQNHVVRQPQDGQAWFDLGILQVVGSDPKSAMAAFAQAARYRPQDPYTHAYQGFAMVEAGALKSAVGPLQTALKLDPHNRFAKWALAQAYYRQGDHHLAAKLLNPPAKAIRTAPPS
jgi:cytochrome c-type biogenesis protein CcmH/NrfG